MQSRKTATTTEPLIPSPSPANRIMAKCPPTIFHDAVELDRTGNGIAGIHINNSHIVLALEEVKKPGNAGGRLRLVIQHDRQKASHTSDFAIKDQTTHFPHLDGTCFHARSSPRSSTQSDECQRRQGLECTCPRICSIDNDHADRPTSHAPSNKMIRDHLGSKAPRQHQSQSLKIQLPKGPAGQTFSIQPEAMITEKGTTLDYAKIQGDQIWTTCSRSS